MSEIFKGSTLGSSYEKGGKDSGIKVNKTFMVDIEKIFIESGFNVRELDSAHIEQLRIGFESGQPIPAIVGKVTPLGFKVIDGHHRFEAAKLAGVTRLECKDFNGTDADVVAMMIKSSQGKNLTAVERAKAYQRLSGFGLDSQEIADKVGRSRADVESHILLLSGGELVISAVSNGEVGFSVAVNEIRKSGASAGGKIKAAVTEAKAAGKKKASASDFGFSKKHFAEVMNILSDMRYECKIDGRLGDLVDLYTSGRHEPNKA